MPTFQHGELLPEHEILQYKSPAATEEANQCSDPEEKQAEHGMGLYQINDWKYCCKLLILRSARVLARECVQERQTCSVGSRPTGVKVRSPLAWVISVEKTKRMKPTDKAILGMVSKSPGRNESEPRSGLETK